MVLTSLTRKPAPGLLVEEVDPGHAVAPQRPVGVPRPGRRHSGRPRSASSGGGHEQLGAAVDVLVLVVVELVARARSRPAPTPRGSALPSTATSISRPTTPPRSRPTRRSRAAAATASSRPSGVATLVTPTDDPRLAGLTNTGSRAPRPPPPRPAPVDLDVAAARRSGTWGRPAAARTSLALRLVHAQRRGQHAGTRRRARRPARAGPGRCRPRPWGRAAAGAPPRAASRRRPGRRWAGARAAAPGGPQALGAGAAPPAASASAVRRRAPSCPRG